MASIAPLMTKLVELKRVHIAKYNTTPTYLIVNKHTMRIVEREATVVKQLDRVQQDIVIGELKVAIKPADNSTDIVMEVV